MGTLVSRSVLVTGGNRGIGLATAHALAGRGDRVTVTVRSGKAPAGLNAVKCDVTDFATVSSALQDISSAQGQVEILVANAGITDDHLLPRMSPELFRSVVETNLVSTFELVRQVAKGMLRSKWGRIVLVSSVTAYLGGAGQTNYAASKAGLIGMARSLAWEFGSRDITVNVVAPGLISTDMTADLSDKRIAELVRYTPLGRAGTPDDVASAIEFLTTDRAGFITGAVIPVSGGLGMGH